MQNRFIITSGIFGALTVALGAMGAHALKMLITPDSLQTFETAVKYQMYHTLALLLTGILMQNNSSGLLKWAGRLFIMGIILFSGSLYFLATRSLIGLDEMRWVGAITPFGGLAFISGWLLLAFSFYNKKA